MNQLFTLTQAAKALIFGPFYRPKSPSGRGWLISITLTVLVVSTLPVHAVVMELRDKQTVVGSSLTLNDLLQSSQGLTSDQLAQVLAPTPKLGASETWSRDRIESVLPHVLKLQAIDWMGATECTVQRPSVIYGDTEVRQLIADELIKRLQPGDAFEIIEFAGLEPFPIPDGDLTTNVDLLPNALRHEWTQATLEFRVQGQIAVTKTIRFHWSCHRNVWQAANRINPGDPLTANAFQQVQVDILKLPGELAPAGDFPQDKIAAHAMNTGAILMENDWVEPRLVNRNDLITVLYNYNGISITMQAKALENGVRNAIIQVQNTSSNKIFNARVVEERTVAYEQ